MTFPEYAALDAVNFSTLKEARRSLLHYQHRVQTPREDSTRLALGRATHTATFEPDRFPVEYAVFDEGPRRGKRWQEFRDANPGRTILTRDEYDQCLRMRDAVRSHPAARPYLERGLYEQTVLWRDRETGLNCKARMDWQHFVERTPAAILDLKTTTDLSPIRFGAVVARMGYHLQAAMYRIGLATATGSEVPFVIVAVEVDPPHDVVLYQLDDEALWAGEKEYRRLLRMVAEARDTHTWPGRSQSVVALRLPAWATYDEDDNVADIGIVFGGQEA